MCRADLATRAALDHPELGDWLERKGRALAVISVNMAYEDWTLDEYNIVMNVVEERVHKETSFIVGIITDSTMGDRLRVTLYTLGFPALGDF